MLSISREAAMDGSLDQEPEHKVTPSNIYNVETANKIINQMSLTTGPKGNFPQQDQN